MKTKKKEKHQYQKVVILYIMDQQIVNAVHLVAKLIIIKAQSIIIQIVKVKLI